ncbi:alcohol dehydrogenase catalytic domain-containing protein [Isoptericola sp. NPDC019693]|uniref:alcohol dehydrogenase catalytic domain-containing protein n=1 Tax=Isoptericola sp. NPDC019693 TaxID=3364009 RepID=UPI003794DBE9
MTRTAVAMRVHKPGGPILAEQVPVPRPGVGQVRVDVTASGVCRADVATARRNGSAVSPATPGHEIAGTVAEVGDGVPGWRVGDRVAVGWFGGSCGHCRLCRSGDVVHCADRQIPGLSYPGGWARSVTVPADALARVPDGLDLFDAAPMGCAGVTTFNAVRHAGLRPGSQVAVFGVGGLGHLAVQFAAAMGHEVVAVARGAEREGQARALGAHHYVDSDRTRPGEALAALGGADLIVFTASSTEPATELLDGLAVGGRLTLVGVDAGTLAVPAARLVTTGQQITGQLTGSPPDIEQAMEFALLHGVRPVTEIVPLDQVGAALERLEAGTVRFRTVLDARSPAPVADPTTLRNP